MDKEYIWKEYGSDLKRNFGLVELKRFFAKGQSFICYVQNEYGNYTIPAILLSIDGDKLLNFNIADGVNLTEEEITEMVVEFLYAYSVSDLSNLKILKHVELSLEEKYQLKRVELEKQEQENQEKLNSDKNGVWKVVDDKHIYYTMDNNGSYSVERIVIKVVEGKVKLVYGKGCYSTIESGLESVLREKLREFPDSYIKDNYLRVIDTSERINELYKKWQRMEPLTKEDLDILYGIGGNQYYYYEWISKFDHVFDYNFSGYKSIDSYNKLQEILKDRYKRNIICNDLAELFNCSLDDVGIDWHTTTGFIRGARRTKDAKEEPLKVFLGEIIDSPDKDAESYTLCLPDVVIGDIKIYIKDTPRKEIKLPKLITGDLEISIMNCNQQIDLSDTIINGDLIIKKLDSLKNCKLPKKIGRSLVLPNIRDVAGCKLPEEIGGNLYLDELESIEGVELPKRIGGLLKFENLKSTKGMKLPLELYSLWIGIEQGKNLELPDKLDSELCLRVGDGNDLSLPNIINGRFFLEIKDAKKLKLPNEINGTLSIKPYFDREKYYIIRLDELVLPEKVKGSMHFEIARFNKLIFPPVVHNNLYFYYLECADNIVFPEEVNGEFVLKVRIPDGIKLPKYVNGEFNMSDPRFGKNYEIIKDTTFPVKVTGDFSLGVKNADDLVLPYVVEKNVWLHAIESANGLILPKKIGGNLNMRDATSVSGMLMPAILLGKWYVNNPIDTSVVKYPTVSDVDNHLELLQYDDNDAKTLVRKK